MYQCAGCLCPNIRVVVSPILNPILASISLQLINDFDIKTKPDQQIDVGNIG